MSPEGFAVNDYGELASSGVDISALSGKPLAPDLLEANASQTTDLIGPYHLLELIGCGGMGEVWLAEQTYPVRRRVALKLIKAGMDTREVVTRFHSERQALALMNHPNIAKVFDAGSTSQRRPYFVMEYISGIPITQYCDQHRMPLRDRLELFIQVCEGVQHAHEKAIIHRDLKPSNILIEEVDSKPVPRIIDFGVAKAIAHGFVAETQFTCTGAILGTPTYMSPEQASSSGADVDTRTDVYSLGAVLYELLVGVRQFEFHNLPFDEMLRRLREQEPIRPSTKLRASHAAAEKLGCDAGALARQLRGDLDAITLKALAKERSWRYGSPSELAADGANCSGGEGHTEGATRPGGQRGAASVRLSEIARVRPRQADGGNAERRSSDVGHGYLLSRACGFEQLGGKRQGCRRQLDLSARPAQRNCLRAARGAVVEGKDSYNRTGLRGPKSNTDRTLRAYAQRGPARVRGD